MSEITGTASSTTASSRARTSARRSTGSGPTPPEEEAERALEKVEERNEEWDNDPKWNDDELED